MPFEVLTNILFTIVLIAGIIFGLAVILLCFVAVTKTVHILIDIIKHPDETQPPKEE